MRDKKPQVRRAKPKWTALGMQILAALAEFTDAFVTSEVTVHLRKRRAMQRHAEPIHKAATAKKQYK